MRDQTNTTEKTRVSLFYLLKKFPLLSSIHYGFALFSAYGSTQLIFGYLGDALKKGGVKTLKNNASSFLLRLLVYGVTVYLHVAIGIWLEELYTSHLRKKLTRLFLSADFNQAQKEGFILSRFDSDTTTIGTLAQENEGKMGNTLMFGGLGDFGCSGNNIVYPETYQENLHREKLEETAQKLGIREFIDHLPYRQNLSAGQKQLVSLMRALVRDYEIYLFDEFLSNVNPNLKKNIQKILFSELKNKTVIVISHEKERWDCEEEIYEFTSQKLVKLRIEGDQNNIFLEIFLPEIDLMIGENKEKIEEIVHEVKSLLDNRKIKLRINLREPGEKTNVGHASSPQHGEKNNFGAKKRAFSTSRALPKPKKEVEEISLLALLIATLNSVGKRLSPVGGKLVLKWLFTKENFDEKSNGQLLLKRFNFNIMVVERTLAIIKPDITQKNLIGEIISIWEKRGLRLVEMKMTRLSQHQATLFYAEHREKVFFYELVDFMCSAPVVIVCLEGENAIQLNREIMGATNPALAQKDTIRKIFGTSVTANAVHGSDKNPFWLEGKTLSELLKKLEHEIGQLNGGIFPEKNQIKLFSAWLKEMRENSEPTLLTSGLPTREEKNYENSLQTPNRPKPKANNKRDNNQKKKKNDIELTYFGNDQYSSDEEIET
ncbi:2644_t:CDS:10, partial [Cetraspora pellucida]